MSEFLCFSGDECTSVSLQAQAAATVEAQENKGYNHTVQCRFVAASLQTITFIF